MSKKFEEMSSQELYELAQRREAEEAERANQERAAQIEKLKQDRKQLIKEHKKALNTIEREIDKLRGGRAPRSKATPEADQGSDSIGSKEILEIIREQGPISTADLREAIESRGFNSRNLGQNLTYLKRNKRVDTPARAVYKIADGG